MIQGTTAATAASRPISAEKTRYNENAQDMRCTLTEEITAMRDCGIEGTICRGLGGLYGVYCPGREEMLLCRARGHFRRDGITPLVGDHVTILPAREIDEPETDTDPAARAQRKKEAEALWVIDAIRERKNALIRPPLS